MVLGKLSVPGVLLIWIIVVQGPIALVVLFEYFLFSFSLSRRRPDTD